MSTSSAVRSTTSTSTPWASPRSTSCPAARNAPSTCNPNSRSGTRTATRAIELLDAAAPELLAHRLGAPPPRHDLDPPGAGIARAQLALDALGVEHGQRALDGLGRRRVPERVGRAQAEVPVVLGVGLRVDLREQRGGVDVARLVGQPQVDAELRPVGRQGVDDALEGLGQSHGPGSLKSLVPWPSPPPITNDSRRAPGWSTAAGAACCC